MLKINNISKTYRRGSKEYVALNDISITINKGDYVAVTGASGSGKSTLLNVIGGLIRPDTGELVFNGSSIYRQNSRFTDDYRKKSIGFMFQQFHLMPYLTVLENIKLACYTAKHLENIDEYIRKCSLSDLKNKYPSELSVGEKQRTAFIRAIVSDPDILLADEPTGNLDPDNTSILMTLVEFYHKKGGTVLLVSHDPKLTKYSNMNIILEKGRILSADNQSD